LFVTGGEMPKIAWITEGTFLAIEDGTYSYDLENDFFGYSAMLIAHLTPWSSEFEYLPVAERPAIELPLPKNRETKSLFIAMRTGSALPLSAGLSSIFCRLLFRSLWTHPRIHTVNIISRDIMTMLYLHGYLPILSAQLKANRMHDVLQMLQYNTVVQQINLSDNLKDNEIYENSIVPRLEMNRSRFEKQRQALKRADPSIRSRVLGRALHVVRYNPDLFFRFLSENVPAFV
jgi:hypothetical protein